MLTNRREFIKNSLLLPGAAALGQPFVGAASNDLLRGDRLVLLGTQGGPFIRAYPNTPSSNLIVYKNVVFVIDAGYGVTFKLRDAGVDLPSLRYIFITHHHSDHNLELGPLIYNAWLAGLKDPIDVYGPVGLKSLLSAYWQSNEFDISTRVKDEGRLDVRTLVNSHELTEGEMVTHPDYQVSAIKNIHPPIDESFAFRFNLGDKTVVFSGDTAYCAGLVPFASGADYLVHEVMYPPAIDEMVKRRPNAPKLKASILSHHTSAQDAGKIAQQAGVKNLVLNHFVPPDDKSLTETLWKAEVRKTFSGNVIVGKDLLQLSL